MPWESPGLIVYPVVYTVPAAIFMLRQGIARSHGQTCLLIFSHLVTYMPFPEFQLKCCPRNFK